MFGAMRWHAGCTAPASMDPHRDHETEPMTRLFGVSVLPTPAGEASAAPAFKARSKVRRALAVLLLMACLGAGAWLLW